MSKSRYSSYAELLSSPMPEDERKDYSYYDTYTNTWAATIPPYLSQTMYVSPPLHHIHHQQQPPTPQPQPQPIARTRGRRVSNVPNHGVRMFACKTEGCGKVFKRSEHLKRHIRSIHTMEKRKFGK